jgi:DNA-directed RNA polymerase subunit RPC12/RpoP
MSKCPHCGAEVEFKAKSKQVHCDYCGSDFDPKELVTENKKAKKTETIEGKGYTCAQCGATLMTFDETAVTFCSYCGSQGMLEDKMVSQEQPDLIIPFAKTKEECIANYKKKVSSFLFCPDYMKSDLVISKFRGIYMPYGVYQLVFNGDSTNKGSRYSHRSGDYVYYDDYTIHADVNASYDGVSFDLLSKFYDEYSHAIPFNFQGAEPFNKNYLAGFYADCKDVEMDAYSTRAMSVATNDSTRFMRKSSVFRKYGCSHPVVHFNVGEKKLGMFPVYFLAIRDKNNKYIHYAIVNGQTGKVAADLPISFGKYVLASLLLTIPVFLCLGFLPTIKPSSINIFSIIMAVIGFIICLSQLSSFHAKEQHQNDIGYQSVHQDKQKKSVDFKYLWKYILAVLVALYPIILQPVSDIPYYGASLVSLAFILWSFRDLVKVHNLLVSNKIPQLEKRGGDEHE